MTLAERMQILLADVQFERIPGHQYRFIFDAERQLLHARHYDPKADRVWTTRKWFISEHATDSEILQTVLKLCLTSAEHEAREAFLWRGRAIYGPHMGALALWIMADNKDKRDDPPGDVPTGPEPKGEG